MRTVFTLGLTSLVLVSTSPLEVRQISSPIVPIPPIWSASSYVGANCTGNAFQNFTGSAPSCNSLDHPLSLIVQGETIDDNNLGSVLVSSASGEFSFVFYSDLDTDCSLAVEEEGTYQVDSASDQSMCVEFDALDRPSSFFVDILLSPTIPPIIPREKPLATRISPDPEPTFAAFFFSDTACSSTELTVLKGHTSTCVTPNVTSGSVLLEASFADYTFTFSPEPNCEASDNSTEVQLGTGAIQCVKISSPRSLQITEGIPDLKRL